MAQPSSGEFPIAHHGLRRDLQHGSGLIDAQTAKEAQLDHPRLALVEPGQIGERVVEGYELSARSGGLVGRPVEIEGLRIARSIIAASFGGAPRAGRVHQNAAHNLGGQGQKMRPVVAWDISERGQPEVRFVSKSGGLEGIARPFAAHVPVSEAAHFVVKKRCEAIERRLIAIAPRAQKAIDLRVRCC